MDSIEAEIIKKYIVKDRQERLIWELNNPRKRASVIWRFSGPILFKSKCLYPIQYMSCDDMEKYLLRLGSVKDIYYIGESYIGILPLKQATIKANEGEMCIIYCGKGIGYYQGEQEDGSPPRFLLLEDVAQGTVLR